MSKNDSGLWNWLENRSALLFLGAGVFSLVAAGNYGITALFDSVAFNNWIGLTVLIARVASLCGVAGLSVGLSQHHRTVGRLSRVVVTLALLFSIALLTTAILRNLGVDPQLTAIFGIGTVLLSILAYTFFGIALLRTGGYGTSVGVLLLGTTVALLFGMFGEAAFPLGVVGTVAELALFITHAGMWSRLRAEPSPREQADVTPETVAE